MHIIYYKVANIEFVAILCLKLIDLYWIELLLPVFSFLPIDILFFQHSLRKQDVELMSQLLALNSSIQEFKSNSSSSSVSNYSDTSDAETDVTEIEIKSPLRQAWHQRESSGSDTSDFEPRRGKVRPSTNKQTSVNRDSLGSEISGYYSNSSRRSSLYGSNRSLNAYDVSVAEPMSRSECCSPQPTSPVSCEPPFGHAYHCRQKTLLSQEFMGMGMAGSDPTLNRNYPDGEKLQPPAHGRAYHHGDDNVRRMSLQQKRQYTRRNTAQSTASDLSRSGSDYSLSGYDVDSDNSRSSAQAMSDRLQKWQRSKSSCALNSSHHSVSTPIKNTIKVDLRHNPPTPGTAIELILPIQALQPTRRSSAVRMAERRQVEKLNSLSKRQSTIWWLAARRGARRLDLGEGNLWTRTLFIRHSDIVTAINIIDSSLSRDCFIVKYKVFFNAYHIDRR